jgi:hypothetical protein
MVKSFTKQFMFINRMFLIVVKGDWLATNIMCILN